MRELCSVTTVCRVLLGLDRAAANGTLRLQGAGRMAATLSFERGKLVGAVVDRRVPSSNEQLLAGILSLCVWEHILLRFVRVPHPAPRWKLGEPVAARAVALQVMRAATREVAADAVRADLGRALYHLTEAGEVLVRDAELRPQEVSTLFWLRRGVCAEEVSSLPGCGLRGYRFVWILKLLRGVAPKGGGSYPLLLRKRREVRRQASACALLDLPEGAAGSEARRALRKLVRHLHPDRFGGSTPPALRRASGEIMTELLHAEATIAAGQSD